MTKEALKLALEALETPWNAPYVDGCDLALGKKVKAITAIKEALANEALDKMAENARELGLDYEPEQEPVAFINVEQRKLEWAKYMSWDTPTVVNLPKIPLYTTPRQPKQEPVAWGVFEGNLHDMFFTQSEAQEMAKLKGTHAEVRPLYTTPPQRPWVGLTDEEIRLQWSEFWEAECHPWAIDFAKAIEAKLKEKNNG